MTDPGERTYLQVTPTSEEVGKEVQEAIESLHKLTSAEESFLNRINPLANGRQPRFEFTLISEGEDEPVECYYGADEHLETLEERLRAIYPETFDIERVSVDLARKIVRPAKYTLSELAAAAERGELHYDFDKGERATIRRETESDDPGCKKIEPVGDREIVDDVPFALDDPYVAQGDREAFQVASPTELPEDELPTSLSKPTAVEDEEVLARPALDELHPVGVQWQGKAERKQDWMTSLVPFNRFNDESNEEVDKTNRPLTHVINQLVRARQPLAFQVVFERRANWTDDAEMRKHDLRKGRDTWIQRLFDGLLESPADESLNPDERQLPDRVENRIESIGTKTPKRSFTVNLRAIATPPSEAVASELDTQLQNLCSAFDSLDGDFYEVTGKRLREAGLQPFRSESAEQALQNFLDRGVRTGRGKTRPDLVLGANELSNFLVLPSATQLTRESSRGTRAEQQSRNPLPRPHQGLMREFRDGMAVGHALDESGDAEDVPTHIPPALLPTHYGRFGTTGSGKSKALINDILSLYANTEGPVVLIDPKGDGMTQNYMRSHARRFGMADLEENVVHFPIPEVLPGFSFFNLEPALANGRRRDDAIQRKADHYEEILKLVMGEDRYERATVAPTLIKTLIKALFDEEYGRENGTYRESTDYFAHRQLEHAVDQLWEAGPPNENMGDAPRSSDEEVTRSIRRQLQLDQNTFANVMGGVGNRLAYISQDTHLRRVFNNTENQFDFRDVLDENTVILFDLGDLRDEAARIMTGVILTNLDDALKEQERDLDQHPDDHVVNLLVDEAASVVVSDIMNDLLEKGRSFGLSVGLSMQFPEQMEAEGGRKVYLNALNNIGSSLVGKINVDRELAQAMAHEEMDPTDFANRIRSLPRGEWIASLPSPTFGETGPYPFSLKPLPIPNGHPESDHPLTEQEEKQFSETLASIHEHVADEFGVAESTAATTRAPEELDEVLSVTDSDLDVVMATVIRRLQLQEGTREENGWVDVQAVDDELRRVFKEVDAEPPSYDELADIRERSRFLDTTVDIDADEIVIRLTEAGESEATPDTGDVQAAGGRDHDTALLQIEEELTSLGFTVSVLSQDGSEKPDARATHPNIEATFAVEVETTTPENPAKVLTNFRKAQEAAEIPLFVVRPGESKTTWAERVEGILSPPVRELQSGETRFYSSDSDVTFGGGATEEGGVTAVRPANASTDGRQSIWYRDGDDIVLRDAEGTEYTRLPSLGKLSKDRVPAVYSYDHAAEEYVVYDRGEQHIYDTKASFEADWVRIKKPFVPESELPTPNYGSESYAIIILPDESEPVVYDDGETRPVGTLFETIATSEDAKSGEREEETTTQTGQPQNEDIVDDPDAVVEWFAEAYLTEDPESTVAAGEVYETYEQWAETHDIEPDTKSWFARRLSDHAVFERTTERDDGDPVRYYEGLSLEQPKSGET